MIEPVLSIINTTKTIHALTGAIVEYDIVYRLEMPPDLVIPDCIPCKQKQLTVKIYAGELSNPEDLDEVRRCSNSRIKEWYTQIVATVHHQQISISSLNGPVAFEEN